MYSQTYGQVTLDKAIKIINDFYLKNKECERPFHIVVGTDSQNFEDTKVVAVIT